MTGKQTLICFEVQKTVSICSPENNLRLFKKKKKEIGFSLNLTDSEYYSGANIRCFRNYDTFQF